MRTRILIAVAILLLGALAGTVAGQPADGGDECMNEDRGPDDGPPGFVADRVPDFLGDLFAWLPVPNFVKTFFGAPTC